MIKITSKILIISLLIAVFSISPANTFAHGAKYYSNHYHVVSYNYYSVARDYGNLQPYNHTVRKIRNPYYNYNGYKHWHTYGWDGCGHTTGTPYAENYTFQIYLWSYYPTCTTLSNPWAQ